MEQNRNKHNAEVASGCLASPADPGSLPRRGVSHPDALPAGRASTSGSGLYREITTKIIVELEAGRVPWVQPWRSSSRSRPTMPVNATTGRPYSGINVLMLWASAMERGYPGQRWLTFRQALALGGNVRRGERATTVVYVDHFVTEDERRRAADAGEEARWMAFLKQFQVFNTSQCDGLPDALRVDLPHAEPVPMEPWMEALILAMRVDVQVGGDRARYNWFSDRIDVPPPSAYPEPVNWYRTILHELAHATGHKDRLARDLTGWFGSAQYAREELVAELAAAFLCATLGTVPTVRHADYIGSWLEVLREDDRALVRAASLASKAADYMLGFIPRELRTATTS